MRCNNRIKIYIISAMLFLNLTSQIYPAIPYMREESKLEVLLEAVYNTSWALLIGINKYPNLPANYQLKYAVKDVQELQKTLQENYGFPESNIITITDENATRQGIIKALGDLTDRKKINANDRVMIYFSGHGQTIQLPDGGEMGFIIPYDAVVDLNDTDNPSPYYTTCIGMDELKRVSRLIPAKHVIFLIDSCYSGLAISARGGLMTNTTNYIGKIAGLKARQVITAGVKGEKSYENPDWGHGAFTYKLLEALRTKVADNNDDGIITGIELATHLRNVVPNIAKQTPQYGYFDGEGEFLFVYGESGTKSDVKSGQERSLESKEPVIIEQESIISDDGAKMILIPAGEFMMGSDTGFNDEKPPHNVYLDDFYIDVYEITNALYRKFVSATGYKQPAFWDDPRFNAPDQPVVGISWEDAKAYCEWAGKRLPTEAEWEKAERGGLVKKKYPWGDDASRDYSNYMGTGGKDFWSGISPVGSFLPNGYGLFDMAGNVNEWCSDWYDSNYYKKSPEKNPTGAESGRFRVMRGGAWNSDLESQQSSVRSFGDPVRTYNSVGFRCVKSKS